jgi:hypothetical protein
MTKPPRKPCVEFRSLAEPGPADDRLSFSTLLSPKQVAEIFNRKERMIRNWVRAGYLQPVHIGGAVFVRADVVAALLEAGSGSRQK